MNPLNPINLTKKMFIDKFMSLFYLHFSKKYGYSDNFDELEKPFIHGGY